MVPNATTLGKIGRDPAYPLNGTYRQTANIDGSGLSHSIGNKTHAFTGEYNGLYRAITGLDCCLVDNLEGEIGNLHFTGANIISTSRPAGVVACEMGGNGTIRHISVHKSKVITTGNDADAGIGVGVLLGGTLDNIFALHSKVTTTGEGADAGIGSGSIGNGSAISRIGAFNSQVTTTGNNSNAAIGAGYVNGTVVGTSAYQNKVTTSGAGANAGIGAGAMGDGTRLADTFAKDCKVFTSGAGANAGIGAGRIGRSARVANTSAQCFSSVITTGDEANAGIGAGFMDPWARIVGTRSRNSKVVTSGVRAHAGIGAGMIRGNASVIDTLAVNSRATASGNNASADIGAGRIEPGGVVTNTTQVNTGVLTCEPAKPAYTPASVVTASNTAMSVSDFPGATMTLPTSAAPLANTLSNGAIAGITLGAAVAFALAGVVGGFIYRHCYCRPYPADDGAPQNENRQSA
ncbi:hypothetical protein [Endozoicomonas sp. GU-1]|uniref:hypothetical protein n=1 Tax=Endozoicomonas sp. GU-1 TaxID=3009078 RepID=UPI0022B32D3E|nr:hypothetical protein [Endozoicomonas sp. GU-1]WBA83910.1 hypothetical protein O2T12_12695 [Endozoicomonas sp. GU-1]WBA86891.1 hypothetical protein O3276_02275 [Endozoicomonas sp. GU-1]